MVLSFFVMLAWLRHAYINTHTHLYFIFEFENILEVEFLGSILLLFGTLVLVAQIRPFHIKKLPLKREVTGNES